MRRTRGNPILAGVLLILLGASTASAQDEAIPPVKAEPFPAWMDQTTVGTPRANPGPGGFNEPGEPSDPDPASSLRAPQGPAGRSRFQFTPPKKPDFARFRKMATRVSMQRNGSDTEQIRYEFLAADRLTAEEKRARDLSARLASAPPGPDRARIMSELAGVERWLAAAQELSSILGISETTAGNPAPGSASESALDFTLPGAGDSRPPSEPGQAITAAEGEPPLARPPLTPAQIRRVEQLKRMLAPQLVEPREVPTAPVEIPTDFTAAPSSRTPGPMSQTPPVGPGEGAGGEPVPFIGSGPTTAGVGVENPARPAAPPPADIPARFYRPTARKSIFQESQESAEGE